LKKLNRYSRLTLAIHVFKTFLYGILLFTTCKRQNRTSYYFSAEGNDKNNGLIQHPLKTIHNLGKLHLKAGDTIFLKGGDNF
jgi:hypothetical protein